MEVLEADIRNVVVAERSGLTSSWWPLFSRRLRFFPRGGEAWGCAGACCEQASEKDNKY